MIAPVPVSVLRWEVPEGALPFEHTGMVEPADALVGQEQALAALARGVDMRAPGYHVFVTGLQGGGRLATLRRVITALKPTRRHSRDLVYVYNPTDPSRPRLLSLPPGAGNRLRRDCSVLLGQLLAVVPAALASPHDPLPDVYATAAWETDTVAVAAAAAFEPLARRYPAARAWLQSVYDEVVIQRDVFRGGPEAVATRMRQGDTDPILLAFMPHLFHQGSKSRRAPVVVLGDPTFRALFGGVAVEAAGGETPTHLHLRAGALHDAQGGLLILDAADLVGDAEVYKTLLRALRFGELVLRNAESGQAPGTNPLRPDPAPLHVKVVLLGSPGLLAALHAVDPDVASLFKARAEFSDSAPLTPELPMALTRALVRLGRRERWRPLTRDAVARILEWSGREAGRGGRLRVALGPLADIAREANALAEGPLVTRADVEAALAARTASRDQIERRYREALRRGTIFAETSGARTGQINGLAVVRMGGHTFGRPLRITATCGSGKGGLIHIDRESGLSGRSHTKGLQVLSGFFRGRFSRIRTLALTGTLCFEQSYGIIDGDSASAAELVALISAVADLPIDQGRAITGSVDQHGQIQPIGGVNEKIEGYFRLVAERGLTGTQGVIIPASNVQDLALADAVVEACRAGTFSIWAITRVEEALSLLMGRPCGDPDATTWPEDTVYGRVALALDDLERVARQASKGPEKPRAARISGPTEGGPTEGGPDVP